MRVDLKIFELYEGSLQNFWTVLGRFGKFLDCTRVVCEMFGLYKGQLENLKILRSRNFCNVRGSVEFFLTCAINFPVGEFSPRIRGNE